MKIAFGCDHAGYDYKVKLIEWIKSLNYGITDYGTFSNDSVDYPDFALSAATAVSNGIADFGILICGTGIGVSITANKVKGIRAANCCSTDMAMLAREHNNANMLAFGARLIDFELAKKIVETFLNTGFEGERHKKRVDKIHSLTGR